MALLYDYSFCEIHRLAKKNVKSLVPFCDEFPFVCILIWYAGKKDDDKNMVLQLCVAKTFAEYRRQRRGRDETYMKNRLKI